MTTLMVVAPLNYTNKPVLVEAMIEVFLESSPDLIITTNGSLIYEICNRIDLPVKTFIPEDETEVGKKVMIIEMIRIADTMLIFDDGSMDDYVYYGEKFRRKIKIVNI